MKVIFLVALLVVANCAWNKDTNQVLQRMEKDNYGNQLLNTIQLQLTSGDSADDLVHMLQAEEEKLENQQSVEDKAILKFQNQCVVSLAKLVQEISATRKVIQQKSDLIKQLTPIKVGKQKAKKLAEDRRDKVQAKIKEIDEARDEKQAEWKAEAAEHDKLTAIIQHGRTILQGVLTSSFLQTGTSARKAALMQLSSHFSGARKNHFRHKSLNAIFRILAQVASTAPVQASESVIDKIFGLIQDLLDKIAESRAIEKRDFDHWMKEYNATHKKLTAMLNDLNAKIRQLTIDINVLTKRITIASKTLAEEKVRLEQKITNHDSLEKECDEAGAKYAKDREARDNVREVISDAIGLLVSKIRLLKRYVSERVKTLKKPFP